MKRGDPIHLEVDSTDAHGGVKFTIYESGQLTPYTLLANEYVNIIDWSYGTVAGGVFEIVAAASDTAGARVVKGDTAATITIGHFLPLPYTCPEGVTPYLIAAAGQVTCTMNGYITEA